MAEYLVQALKEHCDIFLSDEEMNEKDLLKALSFIAGEISLNMALKTVKTVLNDYAKVQLGIIPHW